MVFTKSGEDWQVGRKREGGREEEKGKRSEEKTRGNFGAFTLGPADCESATRKNKLFFFSFSHSLLLCRLFLFFFRERSEFEGGRGRR